MDEWRFVSTKHGIQFAMSTGITLMQVLYVISWDSLQMVSLLCTLSIYTLFNNNNISIWLFIMAILVSGALALKGVFTERVWPLTITNITCSGSETNLLECSYSTEPLSACSVLRDASVACQSICPCNY